MELRTIATFLQIVESGSFSGAAAKLGYTQSAVTMQVKQLESELGAALFDRLPRGVTLTQEGERFAFYACEVMSAIEKARSAAANASQGEAEATEMKGTLRVGAVESITTAVLPGLLDILHRKNPGIEIVVHTARCDQLAKELRSNALDVFITMEPLLAIGDLRRTVLSDEQVVFAATPELSEAHSPFTLSSLEHMPLVLTERGESYRAELERLLAIHGIALAPAVESGNTELLGKLARQGVGTTFLPRPCVESALASGELVELTPKFKSDAEQEAFTQRTRMAVQFFRHKGKAVDPRMRAFIELAKEHFGCPEVEAELAWSRLV